MKMMIVMVIVIIVKQAAGCKEPVLNSGY